MSSDNESSIEEQLVVQRREGSHRHHRSVALVVSHLVAMLVAVLGTAFIMNYKNHSPVADTATFSQFIQEAQASDSAEQDHEAELGRLAQLSSTRLFRDVRDRQDAIRGKECWLHVDATHLDSVRRVRMMQEDSGELPECVIKSKTDAFMHNEAAKMMNNQLGLDKLNKVAEGTYAAASSKVPKAIGFPESRAQIKELLKLARTLKWKVYTIAGGHSAESWGFNDGLVISMIYRRDVNILGDATAVCPGGELECGHDVDKVDLRHNGQTLHMGAGVFWAEAYAMADDSGDLLMGGSCATVGQTGYFMGGGFGYLSGPLGFGSDNVLQFQVITADGTEKTLNRNSVGEDKKLWDALRGGGHAGLAIVTDTWTKLHPRGGLGCLFKIELNYGGARLDVSWVNKLVTYKPKYLHVKPKIAKASDGTFKTSVTFNYFAKSNYDTKEKVVQDLVSMLKKAGAPRPLGHPSHDLCNETYEDNTWFTCLVGTQEAEMGHTSCQAHETKWSGGTAEEVVDSTSGDDDVEWGMAASPHLLIASERGLDDVNIYSDNYVHRTSTKSQLLKKLTQETYDATYNFIRDSNTGLPVYVVWDWFGNGAFGDDDGAVADVHKHYSWLAIISNDFAQAQNDMKALVWSTSLAKVMSDAAKEPFAPHPNLYDRLHVFETTTTNDRGESVTNFSVHEPNPDLMWGNKASVVKAAKALFDKHDLFHYPVGGDFPTLAEFEASLHRSDGGVDVE